MTDPSTVSEWLEQRAAEAERTGRASYPWHASRQAAGALRELGDAPMPTGQGELRAVLRLVGFGRGEYDYYLGDRLLTAEQAAEHLRRASESNPQPWLPDARPKR